MLFGVFVIKPEVLAGWRKALGMKVSEMPSNYTNSKTNQYATSTEKDDEVDRKIQDLQAKPSDLELEESGLSTAMLAKPDEKS